MASIFVKDPEATLDYQVDWSSWLATDDTITTSAWTVPDGITKEDEASDDTTATIWLSGGTAGETYVVVNRIVTNDGRTDERSLIITVAQR